MAIAFENKLREWRNRLKSGPVGSFFRWWFSELREALPRSWRDRLQHAFRRVTLLMENGTIQIGVDENRSVRALETFSTSQDAPLQRQQVNDLLSENELQESPRFLLLNADEILSKVISLPLAAETNLEQVIRFEMDRQTPFRASDVYFGFKILDRGGESGQIRIELFVAPRSVVDGAINILRGRGLAPYGIDVIEDGKTKGLNLLPPQQRVRIVNRKARLNYALAACTVMLLALVMTQSMYFRSHQVTELEEAIAAVQDEARHVSRLREDIEDSSAAAGFLTVRRAAIPLAIDVLANVTRILPDDTYLDRLVISQTNVQMQGKSQNAQRLIELVNESELMDDASFRGSTRLDARTGLEIFEINASLAIKGDS